MDDPVRTTQPPDARPEQVGNFFEVLGLERLPWLDEEDLKHRFHSMSATIHPDKVHNAAGEIRDKAEQRFILLNAAYQELKDPRRRLRYFLELETGRNLSEISEVPESLTDWFQRVHRVLDRFKKVSVKNGLAASNLEKVQKMKALLDLQSEIQDLATALNNRIQELNRGIIEVSNEWGPLIQEALQTSDPDPRTSRLRTLLSVYYELTYLQRWLGQVQQKAAELFQLFPA